MASEYQKLKKKADKVFSEYIRRKYADDNGYVQCVTCGVSKPWKEMQAGHFISRTYNSTRFLEQNVNPQCVSCNVYHSGRYIEYTLFMISNLGKEAVDTLLAMKHDRVKYTKADLELMIEGWKKELEKMK